MRVWQQDEIIDRWIASGCTVAEAIMRTFDPDPKGVPDGAESD